ncbi:uncharacterized protein LOC105219394 isoform X2 [Zeugodacus cucurbitae]|uniref:uncharacterized protein LOC105219394 isoform X2 n=1 Tax=Zeugodacus cucurbitae TaxID=28588 RepID=UPI000596AC8F|nr:uncharacterized protein LOC105219394 isoform X2 [Zeugodacus cucurbitae]
MQKQCGEVKRNTWKVIETTTRLLKCYLARREEFLHQRRKHNAYAHVSEDILAEGFTNSSTVIALENKMPTLLSAIWKKFSDTVYRYISCLYYISCVEYISRLYYISRSDYISRLHLLSHLHQHIRYNQHN